MTKIKSYTDISQSKKLAEILPIESADMTFLSIKKNGKLVGDIPFVKCDLAHNSVYDIIACWSLSALLDVLPKGTNISTPKLINALSYCCWNQYDEIYADNPIDACYEMILKLNELKLL